MYSKVCKVKCGVVLLVVLIASLLVGILGCAPKEAEEAAPAPWGTEQPIVIRMANEVPITHSRTLANVRFKEILESEFPGRVEVRNFPAGQLYTDVEALDAILTGDLEFSFVSMAKLTKYNRKLGIFYLPYLFPSDEALWGVMDSELGQKVTEMLHGTGLKIMGLSPQAGKIGISAKESLSFDWAGGKKIRVWEPVVLVPMVESWGASSLIIPFSECASALETGVIDGIYTSETAWKANLLTIGPSYSILGATRQHFVLVTSYSWCDSLPVELRTAIDDAAEEMLSYQWEAGLKSFKEVEAEYLVTDRTKKGMYYLSPEEEAPFIEAALKIYPQLESEFGEDLIALAEAYRSKYTK